MPYRGRVLKRFVVGAISIALLSALNHAHASGMCTGEVVNTPVRLMGGGSSEFYEVGEVIWYITQYRIKNGRLYLCAWSGDCVLGKDVFLRKKISVHGDVGKMSGIQIKRNSYESDERCTIRDIYKVD